MERGVVVKIEDDRILVETEPDLCCEGCAVGGSCAIGAEAPKRRIWMDNGSPRALPGDEVEFHVAQKAVVAASSLFYLFPVVMLIAGLITGAVLDDQFHLEREASTALFGGTFLVMSFLIIKAVSVFINKRGIYKPILVGIVGRSALKEKKG
jgi:positive regulator of sigma E activity